MPLQPVALADTYRNISLKQDQFSTSFSTLTANAVTDTLTLVAGPGISFQTASDTITILNDFGDENATLSIRALLVDNISIDTNVIQITESNADLELRANGSGQVYVNDALTVENSITAKSDLEIQGGDITTNQPTFNLINNTATTVNFAGAATSLTIGATTGTITLKNASTVLDGDLQVKGDDLTTNQTVFNLLNTTATTINFGGAATTIEIGAATGTTNINNNLDVDGDINFDGGDLTVSTSTFNLANTNATTINFAGAATTIEIGASTGTTNVNNNLDVDGDVNIDGNDLTTSVATFNLLNTTATAINAFGSANNVNVGNNSTLTNIPGSTTLGNLTVNALTTFTGSVIAQKDITVWGSLNLTGDINGGPLRTDDIQIAGNRIETTVSNSNLELNTVGSGSIDLFANTNISGNLVINSQLTLTTDTISTVSGNSNLTLTAHGTGRVIVETFAFSGNNLDTTDSSGISITPSVTFESDIIAQNGIHTQGHIVPDTDLAYKLGSTDKRFSTAYIDRLTTVTDVEVQFGGTGNSSFTTNGVVYGSGTDPLQVTAASNPGSNATTSYGILTTDGSNVPTWTDVIDGGSY